MTQEEIEECLEAIEILFNNQLFHASGLLQLHLHNHGIEVLVNPDGVKRGDDDYLGYRFINEPAQPTPLELLQKRAIARQNKNYDEADLIREHLAKLGWKCIDIDGGAIALSKDGDRIELAY